jgi:hypothetical protein
MLVALMAFSLSLPWSKPSSPCPPTDYVACPDAHRLATNPGFKEALRRFVGDAHGSYLHGDKPLYGQVIQLISSPTGPARDIGGGARLYPGCRFLSCPEKAAVIVDRYGVQAIGIINYGSDSNPNLEVIVRRPDARTEARAEVLRTWADLAVAQDSSNLHTRMTVKAVRIRSLDFDGPPPPPSRWRWPPTLPPLAIPHL